MLRAPDWRPSISRQVCTGGTISDCRPRVLSQCVAAQVYKAIVNKPIASVRSTLNRFSAECSDLIMKFLERKVECRLGCGEPDFANVKRHPFFKDLVWEDLSNKRILPGYAPGSAGAGDNSLSAHYERKMQRVTEVAAKPVGLVERVRRRSVEMLLGADAAPDAAQMAALLGDAGAGEGDAADEFAGFGFAGQDSKRVDSEERALALALFTDHDKDGNGRCVAYAMANVTSREMCPM